MFAENTTNRILIIFAILFIATLSIYSIFLVPRPFYIQSTDIENGYYYDARLIYEGISTKTVTHPATPLFYIYSKVFIFTGDDIPSTQQFLRVIYFIHALLTILALTYFIRRVRTENVFLKILTLLFILGSPSFLTYQDYIGADAVVVLIGLPLLTFVWNLLKQEKKNIWLILLVSVYFGFIFAVKFSFIFLIIPSYAALLASVLLWKDWGAFKTLLFLPISSLVFFFIFISRVVYRLPAILNQAIIRDISSTSGVWSFLERFYLNVNFLILERPIFTAAILFISTTFTVLTILYAFRLAKTQDFFTNDDKTIIPAVLIGAFGILALIYTLVVSGDISGNDIKGEELGVSLRNIAPALLLFPFIVITIVEILKRFNFILNKKIYLIAAIFAFVLIAESVISHISYRNTLISSTLKRMAKTEKELLSLVPENEAFAIWGTDSKVAFGEAMFHYWGNHKYAWSAFDKELAEYFGDIEFFHFRVAGQLVGQGRLDTIDRNYALPGILQENPFLANLYSRWRNRFPPPNETDNILTAEGIVKKPKVIMFPETEREISHDDDVKLLKLFEHRFGIKYTKTILNIEGRDWTIFTSVQK